MSRASILFSCLIALSACDGGGDADAAVPSDSGPRPDVGPLPDGAPRPDSGPGTPDSGLPPDTCDDLTLPALGTEEVAPGTRFERPVFLTQPAGVDGLFIVEQPGQIRVVRGDGSVETFLDLRSRVDFGGERGLLGLAFHPSYADNGRFFIYYTPSGAMQNVVAEYAAPDDRFRASDTEVARLMVINDPESNHNGGMVAFGPDGHLYVGTGDGGGGGDRHGPTGNGLNRDTLMGKILRLDVDAAPEYVPSDNPFVGGGGLPQIWAYGLRNPWRFSFDRATGDLYIGDVGQNVWEEIDFQPASSAGGENYGWRAYEGFEVFNAGNTDLVPEHAEPVLVYAHDGGDPIGGCSVTGGYVYRGSAIPALQGWYFFGDYCNNSRVAFKMCDGAPAGVQIASDLSSGLSNIASFGEDADGELYMIGTAVQRIVAR
ncbi:MAG: PQQ-dependent sugar dehydrogenase [Sandaracinaceae bacterium]|nr:glucose dehydrogenase [Myxococcales bacterium]